VRQCKVLQNEETGDVGHDEIVVRIKVMGLEFACDT